MCVKPVCRLLWLVLTFVLANACFAQHNRSEQNIVVSAPLSVTRLYSDSDGESHFEDIELPFELKHFAPPAPPISVSEFIKVEGFVIITSPSGWFGDWHPAPRRQYMFCLSGELEVEVSDGETRRFGPGAVLLVEDTSGKGHVSRVVGDNRGYMAAMPVNDKR
jgi:hypothetical protein